MRLLGGRTFLQLFSDDVNNHCPQSACGLLQLFSSNYLFQISLATSHSVNKTVSETNDTLVLLVLNRNI